MLLPLMALIAWELWPQKNWAGTSLTSDATDQLGVPWLSTLQGL